MQRILGSIKTGVILKDVSLTLHSGEVLAVLGSKGEIFFKILFFLMI